MPASIEQPAEPLDQAACDEFVAYGDGLDGGVAREVVDDFMLKEYVDAQSMSERDYARTLAKSTVGITKTGHLGPDKHHETIEATKKLIGATVRGSVAENVMAIKGCHRCIQSGECALQKRLTEHETIGARAKTALEKLHEEAVRIKYLHGMAHAYGQWSAAEKRITKSPKADQLSDLRLANSSHQQFRDTLLGIENPRERDQIIKGVYGFIPGREQQSFSKFINGVAAELFVYEALQKFSETGSIQVRLADATEDIRTGTDMLVTMSGDNSRKNREIPIDAKSRGAFHNLVESGQIRQLDRQGYFGVKENQQHQEILVINPDGLNDEPTELIPGTNCQSFKSAEHAHKLASATHRMIQHYMTPKTSNVRTFSAE